MANPLRMTKITIMDETLYMTYGSKIAVDFNRPKEYLFDLHKNVATRSVARINDCGADGFFSLEGLKDKQEKE